MFFYFRNSRNMTLFLNVCGKERKFHFNILYSSLFPTCHGFPSQNSTSLITIKSIRPVISLPPLPTGKIRAKIQGNATWDIELGSCHHTAVPPFQRIALSEFGSKYPNRIDFTTDHSTWSTLLSRWYPTLQTPMNG